MKLWVFSDLHLEFGGPFNVEPPADADVAVCAGDVLTKGIVPSLRWLGDRLSRKLPVVFVAGNHEYYGASVLEGIRDASNEAGHPNVYNPPFILPMSAMKRKFITAGIPISAAPFASAVSTCGLQAYFSRF